MKNSIDPNLNNNQDDVLESIGLLKNDAPIKQDASAPEFNVVEKTDKIDASVDVDDILKEIQMGSEAPKEHHSSSNSGEHHHHHHHSDEHHHHHSGEHHHSSSHHSGSHHSNSHHSNSHHSSKSHHSSSHPKSKKKKKSVLARVLIAILLIIALIISVTIGTFVFLRGSGKKDLMPTATTETGYQDTIIYNGHTYKYNNDMFAIAFIGVDQEDMKTRDETDFVGAADADIVIAINTKTGKSSAIVIPRDTMVDVDVWSQSGIFLKTINTQLCLAYAYADGREQSCKNTVAAMSRVLYNVPIEKYFVLDLSGVPALNDAIGGVTVDALYSLPNYGINKGDTVTLHGEAAKAYVRSRDTDYLEASLNRVDRQAQYIRAYGKQLVPAVLGDFGTVSRLYNTATNYSQTNITLNNATYIASLLVSRGITDFDSYTLTGSMEADPVPQYEDLVHAMFTPDEDYLMQTVLNVFYTQVD